MTFRRFGDVKLPDLTDAQYDQLERRLDKLSQKINKCPTCDGHADENGIWITGTYKLRGEEHECDCKLQMALRDHYLLAGIGEQYIRLDWSEFQGTEAASEMVDKYLAHWQNFKRHGWGLEFGGPVGVGKTFCATHVGKELIKKGQRVFFLPFVEMVSAYQLEDAFDFEERMRNTTYLILDELLPPWSDSQHSLYAYRFEALIRYRTNNNLPTIITTNLTQDKLHEYYPRIYSLLAAKQERVDMSGADARKGIVLMENTELIINGEVRPIK